MAHFQLATTASSDSVDNQFQLHIAVTKSSEAPSSAIGSDEHEVLFEQAINISGTEQSKNVAGIEQSIAIPGLERTISVSHLKQILNIMGKGTSSPVQFAASAPTSMDATNSTATLTTEKIVRDPHVFDFLGLPRELRDMIYQFMTPEFISHQHRFFKLESGVGLLHANKQIFHEFYGMYCVDTPYQLTFWPCINRFCPCRGTCISQGLLCLRAEPPASKIISAHRNVPITLSRKHIAALRHFKKIRLCWSATGAANHNGVAKVDDIVDAIAPAIATNMQKRKDAVLLKILWSFRPSEAVKAKGSQHMLARSRRWEKAFKKRALKFKTLENELTGGKHGGNVYSVETLFEFSPQQK